MECCNIWEVFDEKNNLIKEYKHWKLLVRNRNWTLGNCVAITKRHMPSFSEITEDEMADLTELVKDAERALKKAFNYDKINWMSLMMKDPHLHFHIVPRYSSPRQFEDIEWTDEGWPKLPAGRKEDVPKEVLQKVKQKILENI
ncbi:MAG: HIT family protein [Candidatus Aenigmatarchaeota archaeon]|nr:MAG: HIT family protein [Candidatus Aenigmarchaeota archaeon]